MTDHKTKILSSALPARDDRPLEERVNDTIAEHEEQGWTLVDVNTSQHGFASQDGPWAHESVVLVFEKKHAAPGDVTQYGGV